MVPALVPAHAAMVTAPVSAPVLALRTTPPYPVGQLQVPRLLSAESSPFSSPFSSPLSVGAPADSCPFFNGGSAFSSPDSGPDSCPFSIGGPADTCFVGGPANSMSCFVGGSAANSDPLATTVEVRVEKTTRVLPGHRGREVGDVPAGNIHPAAGPVGPLSQTVRLGHASYRLAREGRDTQSGGSPPPQRSTPSWPSESNPQFGGTDRQSTGTRPGRWVAFAIRSEKAEKVTKRESALQDVESSTKQLRELLQQNTITGATLQPSDDMKALYERCDRLRPSLFRLASETMDEDVALLQILAANDELTLVVNDYKNKVGKRECNGRRERSRSEDEVERNNNAPKSPREIKSYHLIDLSALDSPQTHRKADSLPSFESSSPMCPSFLESSFNSDADQDFNEPELKNNRVSKQETSRSYSEDLLQLNGEFQMNHAEQNGGRGVVLRARGCGGSSATSNGTNIWSLPQHQQFTESGSLSENQKQLSEMSGCPEKKESLLTPRLLKNIFVPVHTIKPSNLEPITVYDHGGVHVSLHFARDSPLGYPGVAVVVSSTVNTSALQVKDFLFQAAVPKVENIIS
ncbi:ADP-ribosylation factor-binding protein GGA1-like [Notothenia coriiceps]|uniref:ADP-ribosylation factor-binding protein GGA1-like n=1 Tax=Notothenia coriiceps TaxID=8208 RepID=A0A6I9N8Q0_9TELE|nr:PREDICTED: ADP-ribosylation factor-binding protein GGA1-like [Notothenia coriiceps]